MTDCQVKKKDELIKTSETKEFRNVAADEKLFEPTDGESIEEVGL